MTRILSKLVCPYCGTDKTAYDRDDVDTLEFDGPSNTLTASVAITCAGCGRSYSMVLEGEAAPSATMLFEDPDDVIMAVPVVNDFFRKGPEE